MLKVFRLLIVFIICDPVVFQYRHKPSTLEQSSCFLKAVIASLPFISFVNEAFFLLKNVTLKCCLLHKTVDTYLL